VQLFLRHDTAPTWVLSNHDLVRHPTRFGGGDIGRRRGLAFSALLLALPGAAYLYQGEELGLEESDVPPDARQDPVWLRSGRVGRDGARTPMPWTGSGPGFGFTTGTPWLPFDDQATVRNAETQAADPSSTLNSYRRLLAARREIRQRWNGSPRWSDRADDLIVVEQELSDGATLLVACNCADDKTTLEMSRGAELMVATDDATLDAGTLTLPGATTAWLLLRR
jgi:glycosidase